MDLGRLPECERHLSGAAEEMDPVRSREHERPQLGAAGEMGRGHSLEHERRPLEAVAEMDLDRLPKLQGLSYELRTLPQHSPRKHSASPLLRLEQVTLKRLPRATSCEPPSEETNPEAL